MTRRKADLALPAARAARAASGDAFANQSAEDARNILEDKFGALAHAPAFSVDNAIKNAEITKFLDTNSAQVRLDDGSRGVVVSPTPLQVPGDGGGKETVDAALTSEGQDFVPVAPLADYTVAKDLDEGIDLKAADVTVTPQGPGVAAADPQRVGDSVLWANVAADTDFVVSPTPTGVETFHQVRSQDAPERFALDLTVPEGGEIRRSAQVPAALEITDANGKIVTTVSPAIATDADGTNVPASYTIDNDDHRVTIDVPHRDRDVHYPILVDPVFDILQYLWDAGAEGHYPGWVYGGSSFIKSKTGWGWFGDGIYAWMQPGDGYDLWDTGAWMFHTPGDSSIVGAILTNTYYRAAAQSCVALGIVDATGLTWETGATALMGSSVASPIPYVNCGSSYADEERAIVGQATPGNTVALQFVSLGGTSPNVDLSYLKQSQIYITDDKAPTTGTSDLTNLDPSSTMTLVAADSGTGVKRVSISATDYPSWNQAFDNYANNYDCTALYAPFWGCPQYMPKTLSVGNLPPGQHTIHMKVWDAAGNVTESDYTATNYKTSWDYGGADHIINGPSERSAALAAVKAASTNAARVWAGIRPAEQESINTNFWAGLTRSFEDGDVGPDEELDDDEPGATIASKQYCKTSTQKQHLDDAAHLIQNIRWCRKNWRIKHTPSRSWSTEITGTIEGMYIEVDRWGDETTYFYNYNGHGTDSGYASKRKVYLKMCIPIVDVCVMHDDMAINTYLHGDGSRYVSFPD